MEDDDDDTGDEEPLSPIRTRNTKYRKSSNTSLGINLKAFSGNVPYKSPMKSSNLNKTRIENESHLNNRRRDRNLRLNLPSVTSLGPPDLSPRCLFYNIYLN